MIAFADVFKLFNFTSDSSTIVYYMNNMGGIWPVRS